MPAEGTTPRTEDPGEAARAKHLGFVAHEIRNGLAAALWSVELLVRLDPEERGGDRGRKLAERAQRTLRRVTRLLEDHFLAERLAAGGFRLVAAAVPLRGAIAEAAGRAELAGSLAVDVDGEPELRGDPVLLGRALEALLSAAGRGGAAVRVEARAAGPAVRLVVRGGGASGAALQQPGRDSGVDLEGRALGLTMAAQVAVAHGAVLGTEDGALVLVWPAAARDGS